MIFAYTIKGWGLPIAGEPLNHSALLTGEQIDELRRALGVDPGDEWAAFARLARRRLCAAARRAARRDGRRAPGALAGPGAPSAPHRPAHARPRRRSAALLVELAR